ncbi:MAG: TetR/AcrR family transcriptional regulator [Rhodobacteraceae bacterium]|nr:TetR/AcrR family transcriptional regulator [Paracoccaceae bacterium]
MAPNSKNKTHHHGDLRNALIAAGLDILKHKGLAALTLRACATSANVSHAAPAHHFQGLPGLQAAIAARGFQELTDHMRRELDSAGDDPHLRLSGICEGYLEFANQNPAMFQLMFSSTFDFQLDSDLLARSAEAYGVLSDTCAPFEIPGTGKEGGTEMLIWSLVHGFANLKLSDCLGPKDAPATRVAFADFLPRLQLRADRKDA